VAEDSRSCRVAIVQSELLNATGDGIDTLTVLEEECWGVVQLPATDYPSAVTAPLFEQIGEQLEEFDRNGYRLALVGTHDGLAPVLDRYGIAPPAQITPATGDELRAFLSEVGA
jgi:hypothetical protein